MGVKRLEHVGSHPTWNRDGRELLEKARIQLEEFGSREGTPAYNQRAKELIEGVENQLRARLPTMERVTELQTSKTDVTT